MSFEPAGSTGLLGQAHGTAGARGGDATALMVYNQRQEDEPGVRLAVATPSPSGFGLRSDIMVWKAANATQSGTSGEIIEWTDFAFGEPSVLVCSGHPAGQVTLLVLFWSAPYRFASASKACRTSNSLTTGWCRCVEQNEDKAVTWSGVRFAKLKERGSKL